MFNFHDSRYNRQEAMPEWGCDRQRALLSAKVAVIGAGGVKSTLLLDLVAGGIGNILIIEFDKVELSNLNRQVLYRTQDIGSYKAEKAELTLRELNPEINIKHINIEIRSDNIENTLAGWDLIVEGGSSPHGRNIVNEYCLKFKKPMVHASAQFSYGYVFSVLPTKKTACFACFFPSDHARSESTGAVPVNVLSTSVAGCLGAAEVFKWFLGYEDNMFYNKKFYFSSLLLSSKFMQEEVGRKEDCPVCSKYYNQIF